MEKEKETEQEVRSLDGDMFDTMLEMEREIQAQVKRELAEESKQEEEKSND